MHIIPLLATVPRYRPIDAPGGIDGGSLEGRRDNAQPLRWRMPGRTKLRPPMSGGQLRRSVPEVPRRGHPRSSRDAALTTLGFVPRSPKKPTALYFTADDGANRYLAKNPLALLIGMTLDQQVLLEKAFSGPYVLRERLGVELDAGMIAAMPPDELVAVFSAKPALHRFPGSMAGRVQAVCQHLVDNYRGDAAALWTTAGSGDELFERLRALPGFGEQKARIFLALLAKRLGVRPAGWERAAGPYGTPGTHHSVADIDGPAALLAVREHKRAAKAAAKAGAAGRS